MFSSSSITSTRMPIRTALNPGGATRDDRSPRDSPAQGIFPGAARFGKGRESSGKAEFTVPLQWAYRGLIRFLESHGPREMPIVAELKRCHYLEDCSPRGRYGIRFARGRSGGCPWPS